LARAAARISAVLNFPAGAAAGKLVARPAGDATPDLPLPPGRRPQSSVSSASTSWAIVSSRSEATKSSVR
jgi:hypothetical protein